MFLIPYAHRAFPGSLFDRLDSLFDDAPAARAPSMDVTESDTAYTVALNVPGVAKDKLKVSVEGRRVSIEAEQDAETEKKDGERIVYRERSASRYARSFTVANELDQGASSAKLDNGVLTLTLAKKVPAKAAQIAIN